MAFNLRAIDLNLLPVFEAAYEERSLSRAARRLAMSQPAVSHALSRLRTAFKDDLFIRHPRGMEPTPMAAAIYAMLRGALGSVRQAVSEARGFDPATSTRKFVVAIPHPLGPMIALRLITQLAHDAPNITVEFNTRSLPVDLDRELRDGRVDAAIDWVPARDKHLRSLMLFEDRLVAMARTGHPLHRAAASRKPLTGAQFVALRSRSEQEQQLEGMQHWRRQNLQVALEVSELLEILLVVSRSDLLGLLPGSLAGIARDTFGVLPLKPIAKMAAIPVRLFWNSRRDSDPAHTFLRQRLAGVTKEVVAK